MIDFDFFFGWSHVRATDTHGGSYVANDVNWNFKPICRLFPRQSREVAAQQLQHARAAAQAGGEKPHPPPAGEAHGLDFSRDRWPKTSSHQRFPKEG